MRPSVLFVALSLSLGLTRETKAALFLSNAGETLVKATDASGSSSGLHQVVSTDLSPFDYTVTAVRDESHSSTNHLQLTVTPEEDGAGIAGSSSALANFGSPSQAVYFSSFDIRLQLTTPYAFSLNAGNTTTGTGYTYVSVIAAGANAATFNGGHNLTYGSGNLPSGLVNDAGGIPSAGGTTSGILQPGSYEFIGQSVDGSVPGSGDSTFDFDVTAIPEAGNWMLGVGLLLGGLLRRWRPGGRQEGLPPGGRLPGT